jgi:hypothetical protein
MRRVFIAAESAHCAWEAADVKRDLLSQKRPIKCENETYQAKSVHCAWEAAVLCPRITH